ncbi:hypothetical protein RSOLAG1IB_09852 [Rhizoctonia solani AG-1 IB]|uniref:Uncharacterized protein n=1 Tax=Thanatephorus cucumeris (strain AG1-IB / isolate 7/3/14) TaxID=1108050 RepID=A0A0B7FWG3_THACB|nr:hypothetical protein RSOLAG1IB_09852 [Rhizoctonia solani AG-1 IB]
MGSKPSVFKSLNTHGSNSAPLHSFVVHDILGYRWKAGSKAYYGLVEFRIHNKDAPSISVLKSDFVGILKSSRSLRILEFELGIQSPEDAEATPVRLEDLGVVIMGESNWECIGYMLR